MASSSNTAAEMLDRRQVCLQNGALEFWLVDLEHRQVEVSTPDGRSTTYQRGQKIPLPASPRIVSLRRIHISVARRAFVLY